MKLLVVGLGYVGLANALAFACLGHEVHGLDLDEKKIALLKEGVSPLEEEGLSQAAKEFKVSYHDGYEAAKGHYDAVLLCVGTPAQKDGSCDLSEIHESVECLLKTEGLTFSYLIIRSTVPPLTGRKIAADYHLEGRVISNPEFLRQGKSYEDEHHPERVVVGYGKGYEETQSSFMKELYASLIKEGIPFIETTNEGAELGKYAANSFLATKISFINEIAAIADKIGAKTEDVAKIMASDSRIGGANLGAGIGYGGSCFSKDIPALIHFAEEIGSDYSLLQATDSVNNLMRKRFVLKALKAFKEHNVHKVGVLGLSFKAFTPDVRSSLTVAIVKDLMKDEPSISFFAYDALPSARTQFKNLFPAISTFEDVEGLLANVEGLMILNDHPLFKEVDEETLLRHGIKVVLDGRNTLKKEDFKKVEIIHNC